MKRSTITAGLLLLLLNPTAGIGQHPASAPTPPDTLVETDATFRRHRIYPLPAVFYTPETRWAGGVAAIYTWRGRPEARPVAATGSAIYTQNHQVILEFGAEGYSSDDAWHGAAQLGYMRFPNTLYAIGNDAPADVHEDYTSRRARAAVELKRRVADGLYLGGSYEWWRQELVDLEGGGPISAGVLGSEGGVLSTGGIRLLYDTRDRQFHPSGGVLGTLSMDGSGGPLGGDYEFVAVAFDLRTYVTLRPRHILALRTAARTTGSGAPFQRMSTLGGQNLLRGYFEGRYRDRSRLSFEAEYRLPVRGRFGAVLFAGAGQVAPGLGDLTLSGFHPAAGWGLRFLLDPEEGMRLRLDFGYGEAGSSGMYVTVSEAF